MNDRARVIDLEISSNPGVLVPAAQRHAVPEDLSDVDELMNAAARRLAQLDPPFTEQTAATLATLLSAVQPHATCPHDAHKPKTQGTAA